MVSIYNCDEIATLLKKNLTSRRIHNMTIVLDVTEGMLKYHCRKLKPTDNFSDLFTPFFHTYTTVFNDQNTTFWCEGGYNIKMEKVVEMGNTYYILYFKKSSVYNRNKKN